MEWSDWARSRVDAVAAQGLRRRVRVVPASGGRFVTAAGEICNFASNDYLHLARDPRVVSRAESALREHGLGSGSARLVSGTLPLHEEIEHEIATFLGCDSALLFSSGYLANVGLLTGVCGRNDVIVSDRAVHASLIDGIRLSRAEHLRYRHNDLNHAEELLTRARMQAGSSRLYLVTEAVFSMDGDEAPIAELALLATRFGAQLIVDQAHAVGVYGTAGSGAAVPDGTIVTGTLSKALGAYGGFVGGPAVLKELLISQSRPFIFNTSLPVSVLAGALAAIHIVQQSHGLGALLLGRSNLFRDELARRGFDTMRSTSQVVPILVAGNSAVLEFSRLLEAQRIIAPAIRTPTVERGAERLRFSVTLAHTEEDLRAAAAAAALIAKQIGVLS